MKAISTKKRIITGAVLAAIMLVGGLSISGRTAQAQFVRGPRVVIVPRARLYGYPVYRGPYYYSYTPRYDAGPYDVAEGKGYHDGLDRGREDFRSGRVYDPNNSSHYRDSISSAYRDGFRRGYAAGFRRSAAY